MPPRPPARTPPPTPAVTTIGVHCEKWKHGCGNHICTRARHVVLGRGDIPCDVLFVGEAPGESEDVVGLPFVGPAGKLLDRIIQRALGDVTLCPACRSVQTPNPSGWSCKAGHGYGGPGERPRVAFGNLTGCIPREGAKKAAEPEPEEIRKCRPRLEELIALAAPRLLVKVGKLSEQWLEQGYRDSVRVPAGVRSVSVVHPAAILRSSVAVQGMMIQKAQVTIANAAEEL